MRMIRIRKGYTICHRGWGGYSIYFMHKMERFACKLDRSRPATKIRIETCYISGLTQIDIGASPPGEHLIILYRCFCICQL